LGLAAFRFSLGSLNRNRQMNSIGEVTTVTSIVVRNIAAMQVEKVRTIEFVMARLQGAGPVWPMAVV
jgi:hypothetical protein